MIRRPPISTRTDTLFPTRRSSDLLALDPAAPFGHVIEIFGRQRDFHLCQRQDLALFKRCDAREPGKIFPHLCRNRTQREPPRSEQHTSELQSLMRISYAVFCLKKKRNQQLKRLLQQQQTNK